MRYIVLLLTILLAMSPLDRAQAQNSTTAAVPRVRPFTMVFIADQNSRSKARELSNWMKTVAPYNKISGAELSIKLVTVPRAKDLTGPNPIPKKNPMGCKNVTHGGYTYPSSCREAYLARVTAENGGDVTVAFPSGLERGYASPARRLAVIDMSSDDTKHTLLHELGHTIGDFIDEYNYEAPVRRTQCSYPLDNHSVNVSSVIPLTKYKNNNEARQVHGAMGSINFSSTKQALSSAALNSANIKRFIQVKSGQVYTIDPSTRFLKKQQMDKNVLYSDAQARKDLPFYIPWLKNIPPGNQIVHREGGILKLGSTENNGNTKIGVFRGGACSLVYPTYRAYDRTVMGSSDSMTMPPLYQNIMVEQMGKMRGVPMSSYKPMKVK